MLISVFQFVCLLLTAKEMLQTPKTCIVICEKPPIPWWSLAHLQVSKQNVLHDEYSVRPSRFPFILLRLIFALEADLHGSPSSCVFPFLVGFSQKDDKETIRSSRMRERWQYSFLLPDCPYPPLLPFSWTAVRKRLSSSTKCHGSSQGALLLQLIAVFLCLVQVCRTPHCC